MHTTKLRPLLIGFALAALPQVALAAGAADEFDMGPTWKQWVGWGALGLVGWIAVYFLARFVYGVMLDARWAVDFALNLVIATTLITFATIAAAITLFLYRWPQPWTQIVGYGLIACYVVILLFGLFGRKR